MQNNIKKRLYASLIILGFSLSLGIGYSLARYERQPRMRAALDFLNKAKNNLEKASHDKGGHRVKALKHIKEAIKEVRMGIRYDNKH